MTTNGVFKAVPVEDVPKGAKVLTSTWAIKKKANGDYLVRVKARGPFAYLPRSGVEVCIFSTEVPIF